MNVSNPLVLFLVTKTVQLMLFCSVNCRFSYQIPSDNLLSYTSRAIAHSGPENYQGYAHHSLTYPLHVSHLSTLCLHVISSSNHFAYHVMFVRCHQIE